MLKFLTIVFLTLFATATVSEEYGTMINKGVLCNPKSLVFNKLDREGWIPSVRMSQDSGFVTYIFFKTDNDIKRNRRRHELIIAALCFALHIAHVLSDTQCVIFEIL